MGKEKEEKRKEKELRGAHGLEVMESKGNKGLCLNKSLIDFKFPYDFIMLMMSFYICIE